MSKICVVTGAGPGTGTALARKFTAEGFRVAALARSDEKIRAIEEAVPGTRGFPTDVGVPEAVVETFARIRKELGPVEVLCHNAGSGHFGDLADTSPEVLEAAWRVNTLGLLVCAQQALPDMETAGRGAIIVTGATASVRGGAMTTSFASAKAAQRSLAQSMAKSLGPKGIHVALVIVDGVIDMPLTRAFLADRPDDFFLKPEAIAATMYHLSQQDRSAWTFEADVRPFGEKW